MHESLLEQQQIKLFGTEWNNEQDSRIYIHIYLLLLKVLSSAASRCHGGWVDRFVGFKAVLRTAVLL